MATKPSASYTWATDANFGSGPASGNPTKIASPTPTQGSIPGLGIQSEYYNDLANINGQWITWLVGGSPSGTVDKHIVETDSNGATATARATFGGGIVLDTFPVVQIFNLGTGTGLFIDKSIPTGLPQLELKTDAVGTPTHGALLIEPQEAPSAPGDGEIWIEDGDVPGDKYGLVYHRETVRPSSPLAFHATTKGSWSHHVEAIGQQLNNTVVFATALSTTFTPRVGTYIVHITCLASSTDVTAHFNEVEFSISGDVGLVQTQSVFYDNASLGANRPQPFTVAWRMVYNGPTSATVSIRFRSSTVQQAAISDCQISIVGAYDFQ